MLIPAASPWSWDAGPGGTEEEVLVPAPPLELGCGPEVQKRRSWSLPAAPGAGMRAGGAEEEVLVPAPGAGTLALEVQKRKSWSPPLPWSGDAARGHRIALPSTLPSVAPAPPPHVLKHLFCFSVLEHVTQQFESCLVKHRRPFTAGLGLSHLGPPPSAWHGQELEQGPSACSLNE